MQHLNIISRRSFLDRSFKMGLGVALSTLVDIPFVMKRALAEGNIGLNGKKVLFIWLRFGNDSLNSVVPVQDPAYYNRGTEAVPILTRPNISIPQDAAGGYDLAGSCFDPTQYLDVGGTPRAANDATFSYANAINLGNRFAALHPSLKFLAPIYNAGDLALIHRVGYPKQSRSHFDSQNYWENGNPNNNLSKDGIFYRTMIESGLANTAPLTAVSIQSALPLILRGPDAAMANVSDVTRFKLLGIPSTGGLSKSTNALAMANSYPFPDKKSRTLLSLQYENLSKTMPLFSEIEAQMNTVFTDGAATDNDFAYNLFPTSPATNGGYARPGGGTNAAKYVVDDTTSAYSFLKNLKAAALVLNRTDAIIAGTELGGFDTHANQGGVTGSHANLQRRLGWGIYALRKFFKKYGKGGTNPQTGAKVSWDELVIVTLSEFGRTTIANSDDGTDHAEAGVMFVAGGAVKGFSNPSKITGNPSGVFGCGDTPSVRNTRDTVPWVSGPANQGGVSTADGSMFGVSNVYLKRSVDYRSVLGEVIRKHLGATQDQLDRIIPAYPSSGEKLLGGGTSTVDNTPITGELDILPVPES